MGAQSPPPRQKVGRPPKKPFKGLLLSSEDQLHTAVAQFLRVVLAGKPVFWTTIEHGGYLLGKAGRGRMSRHGIQPGMPDLVLIHKGRAYFIELKSLTGTVSYEQQMTHNWIRHAGAPVVVCRSVGDVADFLTARDIPTVPYRLSERGEPINGNSETARGRAAQSAQGTPLPPLAHGVQ